MKQTERQETDVLIVGGSLEGCIAAASLAKAGRKVLLTLREGSLGGAATGGLEVSLFCEKIKEPRAAAYAEELLEKAGRAEGTKGPLFHDQRCKLVLAQMLEAAGVTVLSHIFPFEVKQEEEEIVCLAECKTETLEIHSRALVDAEPYGAVLAMAGIPWQPGSSKAYGAIKWNGIPTQALAEALEPGSLCGEGFLIGMLQPEFSWKKNGITCGNEAFRCFHSPDFGETIMAGVPITLPDFSIFTLSRAEIALRGYAYRLRDTLRKTRQGFEKASIIHIAPQVEWYGTRRFAEKRRGRLFSIGLEEYTNEKAIEAGVACADLVQDFLEKEEQEGK